MNCDDFNKYLDNYENLTDSEKLDMNNHAEMCEKCRGELELYMSALNTLRTLPRLEPPADFMEKLNSRIDNEAKKTASPSGIVYHVRKNWKQYTAIAACFALVAVITANRGMLLNRYDGGDDGIIPIDTASQLTDTGTNSPSEDEAAKETPTQPQKASDNTNNGNDKNEAQAQQGGNTSASPSKAAARTASADAGTNKPITPPTVSSQARTSDAASSVSAARSGQSSPAASYENIQPSSAASGAETAEAPSGQAEAANDEPYKTQTITETAANEQTAGEYASESSVKGDYGIALAGTTRGTETASTSYDIRADEVAESLKAKEIKSSYSLAEGNESIALGRYYQLDADGNPLEEDNTVKAIGSLKISSSDADRAMEVISRYPHGEDGDLYTTDYEYFSLMLSMLSTEGVSYTNYTPAGSGDIQFRIVFD